MGGAGGHHADPVAWLDPAVHHPHIGDHPAVDVVDRVEDQRPGRRLWLALRRWDGLDHPVQQFRHPGAGLTRDPQAVGGVAADQMRQLLGVLVRLGRRQVDLVEHGDDDQVVLHRQVEIGQGLCLHPLRGVDQQDRALAGGQRPRHLVREIDVPRGVDHVKHVLVPRHAYGLALDRDAALALDIHPVQVLIAHPPRIHHAGQLQHPVGQGRLPVVDVGDDAEVADPRRVGSPGRGIGRFLVRWHCGPFSKGSSGLSMVPRGHRRRCRWRPHRARPAPGRRCRWRPHRR